MKRYKKVDLTEWVEMGNSPQQGDKIQHREYFYNIKKYNPDAQTIETKRGLTIAIKDCQILLEQKN